MPVTELERLMSQLKKDAKSLRVGATNTRMDTLWQTPEGRKYKADHKKHADDVEVDHERYHHDQCQGKKKKFQTQIGTTFVRPDGTEYDDAKKREPEDKAIGPDGEEFDDSSGYYDGNTFYPHHENHPWKNRQNDDDNATLLDSERDPESSDLYRQDDDRQGESTDFYEEPGDGPLPASENYLLPGRVVHDDRRHKTPQVRPPAAATPNGGGRNHRYEPGAATARGNNQPRPGAQGGGNAGRNNQNRHPPEPWAQRSNTRRGQTHRYPARLNGPRTGRRAQNKTYDPKKEYIVNNTDELRSFDGKLIPYYTKIDDDSGHILRRFSNEQGGLALEKVDKMDLCIMLQRMIAIYLHDRRVNRNFQYETSLVIKELKENNQRAEYDFQEAQAAHGYVRPHLQRS